MSADESPPGPSLMGGQAGQRWARAALAAVGTAIAVAAMEFAAELKDLPYGLIPFVTSIALVLALPEAPAAKPRAIIGGHVLSTLVGYAALAAFGSEPWVAALATGTAVGVMLATRTMHPPAGIDPFLVVNDQLGAIFLVGTVLPGAVLLALFGWLWARVGRVVLSQQRGPDR